ncbi:MAG: tRNA pseudouridine(38-40) synthase TruA [Oscillospiraceae bacterium]|jgi:tRNA pseudouridine38-40 synthase|nr:tRNA pseudouridine(38-40) synthase TruA [Oscillospiraceae bacterium]
MRRVKLTLGYDGTNYAGWQRQENALAVQQVVEQSLRKLTGEAILVTGASRTDAGVHALGQVCHFDMRTNIPDAKLPLALNAKLPPDIRAYMAETVGEAFHARFDAKAKIYRYHIHQGVHAPVLERNARRHVPAPLDMERMSAEASAMVGTHDFRAFCAAGSSAKTTVRTVYECGCERDGAHIQIRIMGDHFLYNMVRILAGTLVEVGTGKLAQGAVARALSGGNRLDLGQTAPPQGLVLEKVIY